jgi:carbon monoxide dehydrogenase subunit G
VLRRCISGCEALVRLSDTDFNGTVALNNGAAAANGDVKLTDINAPASYRITGSGNGGPAGMVSGGAVVRLEENAGGTLLSYGVTPRSLPRSAGSGSSTPPRRNSPTGSWTT